MIIFNNTLTGILPAFNNNIIEFKSNTLIESVQAKITINSNEFIIYKMPSGWFRFNFKEIAKVLVNQNNFKDELITNITDIDINTYSYQQSDGYFTGNVNIQVTLIDGVIENSNFTISFLANVYNLEDYKKTNIELEDLFVLLPNIKNTKNQYYFKYYEGYPFDVTIFDVIGNDFYLQGNNDMDITRKGALTRFFFSDGENDIVNNSLIALNYGINNYTLIHPTNNLLYKYLTIDYIPLCGNDAIYLKWFNAEGGYSYYLFNKFYERNLNFGTLGELENDFYNLENTTSPIVQIGRTSFDKIRVDSDIINENEFNLLVGILSSPKVYMFTGLPLARSSYNDWIEVEIKTNSINLRNWKNRPTNIAFEFELPKRNNQYL